ncbi:hypothetical protein GQ53DRAFT_748456 [Thozetella sp. PMI_491]|nr:hypothetical protein GQ53DRAFT_748456 [Thozetella sp. PMI_491]
MISATRLRTAQSLARQLAVGRRSFSATARQFDSAPGAKSETTPQVVDGQAISPAPQAPNRTEVWSRTQRPRAEAMTGPRFEQTDFSLQPQPYAAIELIHQQKVTWTHDRTVACDGGGGPTGHPRIFINTDKPEIATCNYCGLPFANEHHRKHLESLPQTSYPL